MTIFIAQYSYDIGDILFNIDNKLNNDSNHTFKCYELEEAENHNYNIMYYS